jgi:AmiR/NasT family two-component response regulator
MKPAVVSRSRSSERQHLIDEIDQLRRELATRQTFARPAPWSIVYAYHELLERQYDRLDQLTLE